MLLKKLLQQLTGAKGVVDMWGAVSGVAEGGVAVRRRVLVTLAAVCRC